MNKNEFVNYEKEKIANLLKEKYSNDVTVEAITVVKFNDQELTGIKIGTDDNPANPTFYLDDAYEAYLAGEDKDKIAKEVAERFDEAIANAPDAKFINSKEDMADKPVTLRVVETKRNKKFLKDIPYMSVDNGFALICDLRLSGPEQGVYTTVVNNNVLELMGTTKQEIFAKAISEAWSVDAPTLTSIESRMFGKEGENLLNKSEPVSELSNMYVLTTESTHHGAAALFYPEVQKKVAETLGEGYYALPSSTEEFILLPESSGVDIKDITETVYHVNHNILSPDELLSDKVLKYDKETEKLYDVTFGREHESRVSEMR